MRQNERLMLRAFYVLLGMNDEYVQRGEHWAAKIGAVTADIQTVKGNTTKLHRFENQKVQIYQTSLFFTMQLANR